ncbi:putative glycoside hydrolase [Gilvimarinus chinensis]|uniref:putative glycoside hydrolase n=1 Tax=Gilvimarinus chinensis TaxID=396005 RepID=UPI000367BD6B|nr:putative glycoside hydrolase [Gilvimarinus chinensis]
MKTIKHMMTIVAIACLALNANAEEPLNHNIFYIDQGEAVKPWELSLQFGQVLLENKAGATVKNSLVAEPAKRDKNGDAVRFTWNKKKVLTDWGGQNEAVSTVTLINTSGSIDLAEVKDQAALVVDLKVLERPNDHVTMSLESNWDWETRASIPLKSVLRKLPKKEWVSLPLPLQCFKGGDIDFTKLTSMMLLHTDGNLELEISGARLAAFPPEKVTCN